VSAAVDLDPTVGAALGRLERLDPELEAFLPEPDRRGRLSASAPVDGPLRAMPVGVKDLYRVDGLPTTAGSRLPSELFAGPESPIVTTLRGAGAVVLGMTTMDEFAYCEPPTTRNPRDLRRTPGGSSSGSAAAVAAGICPLAIGSQTLQSVLVPAAFCGVVGFKPTFGRVPFDGIALSPSIDTVGWFAPTVEGVRAVASTILPDHLAPTASGPPVLGVPAPWGPPERVGEAWRAFDRHLDLLRAHGVELRPVDVPWGAEDQRRAWESRVGDLLHAEMASMHRPWFPTFADRYRPGTVAGIRHGLTIDAERRRACRAGRSVLADLLVEGASHAGIDAWVCPSAPGIAPIGPQASGFSWMTGLWSYAGLPAISLPVFDGPEGLPLGLQLVGMPGDDERLLAWAGPIADILGSGGG
jgi:Asp-tRNA(Asn)/Glu-tRNA(Gln) amidotransferase A subunit family amidase